MNNMLAKVYLQQLEDIDILLERLIERNAVLNKRSGRSFRNPDEILRLKIERAKIWMQLQGELEE